MVREIVGRYLSEKLAMTFLCPEPRRRPVGPVNPNMLLGDRARAIQTQSRIGRTPRKSGSIRLRFSIMNDAGWAISAFRVISDVDSTGGVRRE